MIQLSKIPLVPMKGLEPPTYGLKGRSSTD